MTANYSQNNTKELTPLSQKIKTRIDNPLHISKVLISLAFSLLIILFNNQSIYSQQYQTSSPYVSQSSIFRQEIARLEITVQRAGKQALSLTQVPRVQAGDVLKVRMLDEPVGGIKPDQSQWDWTLLIAYINPNRNDDKEKSVSQEIKFKEKGWYKEYFFTVPYDSQPVVFLYPKPQYRDKILKLVNKDYDNIRKLGEKTIEIAGAYAQISTFLNELQGVLRDQHYRSLYNPVPVYNYPYNYNYNNTQNNPLWLDQMVEGLAKSFNIQLPSCWRNGTTGTSSSYNPYPGYNSSLAYQQDFVARTQCVAKNVRLEDLDVSITKMWQQGGVFLAAQLTQKYPQIAFWINIAAAAIDFMVKAFQKSALKVVPTIVASQEMQYNGYSYQPVNPNTSPAYTTNFTPGTPNTSTVSSANKLTKISVYAEAPPNDGTFVTAFPVVVHKWQAEPDAEIINLPAPVLLDPCLHIGQNILKNTDLSEEWANDTFTRDFKLVVNSSNGFRKEFFLRKNIGMGGWELNITPQDFASIPKINMTLEAEISGMRGFNEIKSPKFDLPVAIGGTWSVTPETQKAFAIGGKRHIALQNSLGTCRCLQSVTYKPAFGGQFTFTANTGENGLLFSPDGREVSFEVDARYFKPGAGTLELRTFSGETNTINLKLYPAPPNITDVKISKGDNQAVVTGERIEQLQSIKINGKKAKPQGALINIKTSGTGDPNQALSQRVFVFEDQNAKLLSDSVTMEMGLEDDRMLPVQQTFGVGLARPTIAANEQNEIEGIFINKTENKISQSNSLFPTLNRYPVVSIDVARMSVAVQNKLTDYEFKQENLSIETKIEKSQPGAFELPQIAFEVLDGNRLRLNFTFNEQTQKFLGGRRLQFKIRDKERGDSDWYTIKQTFVRMPQIEAVKCTPQMNGQCQLIGRGIDYIQQVSVDGGATWYPSDPAGLTVEPTADERNSAMIPLLTNKKLLQIKLRDFPKTEGLPVTDFIFSNLTKSQK